MRSSGRTYVSRTNVRIDSVRRSRRGRKARAPVVVSVGRIDVAIVVITISVEKGAGTFGGAEPPPCGAVDAVGAEALSADRAMLENGALLGIAATDAVPPFIGHSNAPRRPKFSAPRGVEYIFRPSPMAVELRWLERASHKR